jgi:hypothetical protein
MSWSHQCPSPNAPSSKSLAACHPECGYERQQHVKPGRNSESADVAMLFNQTPVGWRATHVKQEKPNMQTELHPSHPT